MKYKTPEVKARSKQNDTPYTRKLFVSLCVKKYDLEAQIKLRGEELTQTQDTLKLFVQKRGVSTAPKSKSLYVEESPVGKKQDVQARAILTRRDRLELDETLLRDWAIKNAPELLGEAQSQVDLSFISPALESAPKAVRDSLAILRNYLDQHRPDLYLNQGEREIRQEVYDSMREEGKIPESLVKQIETVVSTDSFKVEILETRQRCERCGNAAKTSECNRCSAVMPNKKKVG